MHLVNRYMLAASLATFFFASHAACAPAGEAATQETSEEVDIKKVSEGFGHFIGRNLKTSGLNFDIDSFIQGIRDGIAGKPAALSDKEYERQMMLLQEKAFKRLSEDNLKAAAAFLQKNAKESGIIEIEPGKLQYTIVKEGKGDEVKAGGSPQIQYTGKYLDGTVFGSSQDSGGPITIPLDQTIQGFSKGLKGMKEGEVRKIFVHPDLGYGTSGHLPPNSLLIFEVELIKAESPEKSLVNSRDESFPDDEEDDDEDEEPAKK